jgi:hypothetical protein
MGQVSSLVCQEKQAECQRPVARQGQQTPEGGSEEGTDARGGNGQGH